MKNDLYVIGLIVEGPDDERTILRLCEVLFDLASSQFVGVTSVGSCTYWRNVLREALEQRIPRRHGNFRDEPGVEDARMAVLALRSFINRNQLPNVVMFVRDSDGKKEARRKGLDQAKNETTWPFDVIIGLPHPMRECWVLTAFRPRNKPETSELTKLKKELGSDPLVHSERLQAKEKHAKKSAKHVLQRLLEADPRVQPADREWQCWEQTNLDDLKRHGHENGLAKFIGEVERCLLRS